MDLKINGIIGASSFLEQLRGAVKKHSEPQKESTLKSLSSGTFSIRLEKHLDDYRKGHPETSKGVSYEVNQKDAAAGSILSASDPQAALLYGTYQTALTYGQRARYVKAISAYTSDLGDISQQTSGTQKNG